MGCTTQRMGERTYTVCKANVDGSYASDDAWDAAREQWEEVSDAKERDVFVFDVEPVSLRIGMEDRRTHRFYGVRVGIVNVGHDIDTTGVEVAIINAGKREVNGLQVGAVNMHVGSVNGVQVGVINHTEKMADVVQVGGFNLADSDSNGAQVGVVNAAGGNIDGAQLGGINFNTQDLNGVQAAVLGNFSGGDVKGLQLSGFYNGTDQTVEGIQLALAINYNNGDFSGVQGAFGASLNDSGVSGVVIAPATRGGHVHGAQLGLINYCTERLSGVQLGALNNANFPFFILGIGVDSVCAVSDDPMFP